MLNQPIILKSKTIESYKLEMVQTQKITHLNGSTTIRGYVTIDGKPEWEFEQSGNRHRIRIYGRPWLEWRNI